MKKFLILSVSLLVANFVSAVDPDLYLQFAKELQPIFRGNTAYFSNYNQDPAGPYGDHIVKLTKKCQSNCKDKDLCPWVSEAIQKKLQKCSAAVKKNSITYAVFGPERKITCRTGTGQASAYQYGETSVYDCLNTRHGKIVSFNYGD